MVRIGRSARRKYGKRQMIIKKGRIIHFFKRVAVNTYTLTTTDATTTFWTNLFQQNSFSLDQLPNYTDFTNLYDSYKICGISQKFIFDRNSADTSGLIPSTSLGINHGSVLPTLYSVNDFNDSTAPTNESAMLEYASFKASRLDRPTKRYFRPCQSFGSNPVQIVKSRWNTTAEPDVVHRGIKIAVGVNTNIADSTTPVITLGNIKVYTTFYIACRTAK